MFGHAGRRGGDVSTVIGADAVRPSLVAWMVATPTVRPVTSPLGDNDATALLGIDHFTSRPERMLSLASRVTAVNCELPRRPRVSVFGIRVTVATGADDGGLSAHGRMSSVIAVSAPSSDAMSAAVPGDTPIASPSGVTATTPGFFDVHVGAFFSSVPSGARPTAV